MKETSIHQIADYAEGTLKIASSEKCQINHITIDSRKCRKGSLFIPLKGRYWDGHHFIKDAAQQGATACFFEPNTIPFDCIPEGMIGIAVKDCQKALEKMASAYRKQYDIPIIAVTGSNGKTTTKEMLASVLSSKYKVLKNQGNYNNHIGLPLSIMALEDRHEVAVLEMGMSGPGEISLLSKIACPDYAVITNIGMAHIEKLGSRMNIARAKKEIVHGLKKDGVLLINDDDEFLDFLGKTHKNSFVVEAVGRNHTSACYAMDIEDLGHEGFRFKTNLTDQEVFWVSQPGIHNVTNALFVIRLALFLGLDGDDIQTGLKLLKPTKMRMEICRLKGADVINDAYNANPDSMKAAIHFISRYPAKRKIAVLGDMYEMGSYAEEAHRSIGKVIVDHDIDILITVGHLTDWAAIEAGNLGMNKSRIIQTVDSIEAASVLGDLIQKGDVVLLKASRKMALENIINIFEGGVD